MSDFTEKLVTLWPEIVMLAGAVACLFTGLHPSAAFRKATPWVAAGTLGLAWLITIGIGVPGDGPGTPGSHPLGFDGMTTFIKNLILGMGLILLLINAGVPEGLLQNKAVEAAAKTSKGFIPGSTTRGEFYCFFLLSITGVMLTAGATDLVWLFLALELTSLPTYVMIATSRDRIAAQESAIKYFFLGALSAAVFLYGFALIYGATGFTEFTAIAAAVSDMQAAGDGSIVDVAGGKLLILGVVLSILGLCFKIAAVPMHAYAADVYEGAATPVTAFLAVVPKTAGFAALILVLALVGWGAPDGGGLPEPIAYLLAGIAILTMTVGNVLAIIQTNIKRVLAYSSIAHSGYLLTGLVAGPHVAHVTQVIDGVPTLVDSSLGNGLAAVLFYLLVYSMSTVASFAVLGSIRAKHSDGDKERDTTTYEDLSGLWWQKPVLAGIMLVAMLSLVGMPPLGGFMGKVYLIGSVFTAGYVGLAIVIVVNSAVSAGYYLRIAMTCFFGEPTKKVGYVMAPGLITGALIATAAAFVLGGFAANGLIKRTGNAATPAAVVQPQAPAPAVVAAPAANPH